ncbi:MAG: hypothetical protein JWO94_879 [Verrucomicrobiaceae bacterium]|nr:hypothetical protein [Verrucomicrobiaceae bacterium]
MANKEAKYDKVLLTLAALAALGVSGSLFFLKSSFPQKLKFPPVSPKTDFGVIPQEEVDAAIKRLQQPFEWTAPVRQNKPVPLNKSVTVVLKGTELFDMFLENPKLRPPMTNEFLRQPGKKFGKTDSEAGRELDYLSPNVADLDPDGDGFTNLEEFEAQPTMTNPLDPASHPPVTKHLYFRGRVQNDYILVLQSSAMPLQVKRNKPDPAGSQFIEAVPKDFGFERAASAAPRFTAEKFEKKELQGKDLSELTVLDKATGERVMLVYKVPSNLAEYKADLEFRDKTVTNLSVKKGDNFRLPDVAATFRVTEITEDNATIVQLKENGTPGDNFVVSRRP